ncbi:hypothetical protein EV292_10516 [Sphingomonas sp. BK235]|jgi:hypothetical protein|nr:hypothetical protein EV292_10516 [Sphingomonas sp. BK235]
MPPSHTSSTLVVTSPAQASFHPFKHRVAIRRVTHLFPRLAILFPLLDASMGREMMLALSA